MARQQVEIQPIEQLLPTPALRVLQQRCCHKAVDRLVRPAVVFGIQDRKILLVNLAEHLPVERLRPTSKQLASLCFGQLLLYPEERTLSVLLVGSEHQLTFRSDLTCRAFNLSIPY